MTQTRGLRVALMVLLGLVVVGVAPTLAAQARPTQPNQRPDNRGAVAQDPRYDRGTIDRRDDARNGRGFDLAISNGRDDGYEAGLRDAQRNDRFDPVGERRYRSGDRGYDRRYGPRDLYKDRYRQGFRQGYDEGYRDGRRYDRRSPLPRWWPFGR